MNCTPLPQTGQPVTAMLAAAALCLLFGLLALVVAGRRRRALTKAALAVLLIVGTLMIGPAAGPPTATAAVPLCPADPPPHPPAPAPVAAGPSDPVEVTVEQASVQLTVSQTSVLAGMAPGVAPVLIAGVVQNTGNRAVLVNFVTVRIVAIVRSRTAPPGPCDATDYRLTAPAMPVHQTIRPGEGVSFSGALIGFANKDRNQDGCKKATVRLSYLTS